MSSPIKNIVIAGAGGNLGAPTLQAFLDSPLKVSVLTREDSKSTFPSNVNVIKTDYTKDNLVNALKGQDAVLSFLGAPALGAQQNALVDAAAEAGVKRFIPSEFGLNTGSEKVRSIIPIFQGKRAVVERLQGHSSLTWTAVATGLFLDQGFRTGFNGIDYKNGKATIWDEGSVPFSTTSFGLIARTLVKLLTDSAAYEDSKNKYIYLASYTPTQAELVAATEKATGKKFDINNLNGAKTFQEGKDLLAKKDFSGIRFLISGISFTKIDGEALADYRPLGIFNEKHGINDPPLEEYIKKLIAEQ